MAEPKRSTPTWQLVLVGVVVGAGLLWAASASGLLGEPALSQEEQREQFERIAEAGQREIDLQRERDLEAIDPAMAERWRQRDR